MRIWNLLPMLIIGLLLMAGCPKDEAGASNGDEAGSVQPYTTADAASGDADGSELTADDTAAAVGEAGSSDLPSIEELRETLSGIVEVEFETSFGDFTMEVYPELAPVHGGRFLELVRAGYYDDLYIHRIAPGWVVQWGDLMDGPATDEAWMALVDEQIASGVTEDEFQQKMSDGTLSFEPIIYPQYEERAALIENLKDEPSRFSPTEWTVCFAKGGPDTASTQPFVCLSDASRLATEIGGSFSAFGYITEGRDAFEKLTADFEPMMEEARAALSQVMTEQGAPLQAIEQQLQNDLAWGQFLPEAWDPFESAMIIKAEIVSE